MRILGAVFFLSLLAGKLKTFKEMFTIKEYLKKKQSWRMRIWAPVFYLSLLAGK